METVMDLGDYISENGLQLSTSIILLLEPLVKPPIRKDFWVLKNPSVLETKEETTGYGQI